MLYMPQI